MIAASSLLLPGAARARPFTFGAEVGLVHDKFDSEAHQTLGLRGRVGLQPRLAAQLELARLAGADGSEDVVWTATALLVHELGGGRFVPTVAAGAGVGEGSDDYGSVEGIHLEGGGGLEYRPGDGLVLGLDLRIGYRFTNVPDDYRVPPYTPGSVPYFCSEDEGCTNSPLHDDGYWTARACVGFQF
jgi:hypothetical protein